MVHVGIKALKNNLSEYVRVAAAGETVLVTDRGVIVAELTAPRVPQTASDEEHRLGELMRRGVLTPARLGPPADVPQRHPTTSWTQVLGELDSDRAER